MINDIRALANSEMFGGKVRIVCTLGAQGLMYATDGQASEILSKKAGKLRNPVKDTTGAGDCFLGYLTAGLIRGESVEQALDTCLAVGLLPLIIEGLEYMRFSKRSQPGFELIDIGLRHMCGERRCYGQYAESSRSHRPQD